MKNSAQHTAPDTSHGFHHMPKIVYAIQRLTGTRIAAGFATAFIVTPSLLINCQLRKAMMQPFRRYLGASCLKALRLAIYAGKAHVLVHLLRRDIINDMPVNFSYDGFQEFAEVSRLPGGCLVATAHLGDCLLLPYSLTLGDKAISLVTTSTDEMDGVPTPAGLNIIPAQPDQSHRFQVNSALADGNIVVIPADCPVPDEPAFVITLPSPSEAPINLRISKYPFVESTLANTPIFFAAVLPATSDTYTVTFLRLDIPGTPPTSPSVLAHKFAQHLHALWQRWCAGPTNKNAQNIDMTVRTQHP